MKSKTIKFNVYQFLVTLSVIIGTYAAFPGLPTIVYPILAFASMLVSELMTYQSPSGSWAWESGDWTVGKWVYRIGNSVLIILAFTSGYGIAVKAIALVTPLIEILIRRYGSGNDAQKTAANSPAITRRAA